MRQDAERKRKILQSFDSKFSAVATFPLSGISSGIWLSSLETMRALGNKRQILLVVARTITASSTGKQDFLNQDPNGICIPLLGRKAHSFS